MEISRKQAKVVTAVSLTAWAALVHQQANDFDLTLPIRPALHAEPAYSGGTIIVAEGGFASTPPHAPIEVRVRRMIGGAALPDS